MPELYGDIRDDQKLASNRFRLNRVYKRKTILALSARLTETGTTAAALVRAHDDRFCDVIFEFVKVSGSKFRCFGLGRADRFPVVT